MRSRRMKNQISRSINFFTPDRLISDNPISCLMNVNNKYNLILNFALIENYFEDRCALDMLYLFTTKNKYQNLNVYTE